MEDLKRANEGDCRRILADLDTIERRVKRRVKLREKITKKIEDITSEVYNDVAPVVWIKVPMEKRGKVVIAEYTLPDRLAVIEGKMRDGHHTTRHLKQLKKVLQHLKKLLKKQQARRC